MSEKAEAILVGIGGKGNVKDIEACITRIRVEVVDSAQVDEAALREAGVFGMVLQDPVVQAVAGPEADQLSETLESLRKWSMSIAVYASVSGIVTVSTTVPDPVFPAGIVGPGWAVDLFPGGLTALSPCTGVVKKAMPHVYIIVTPEGHNVLVHLGVDTVELKGQGFLSLVGDGREVSAGQPIAVWNTSVAQKAELNICTPVLCMGKTLPTRLSLQAEAKIEAGKPLFTID